MEGLSLTQHAHDRMTARSIPSGVVEIILTYGVSRSARDGARKHALSGESFRELRRIFGPVISKALEAYRSAYVVEANGKIITAAYDRQPLFR